MKIVIVEDQLDERERLIRMRDLNHQTNGAFFVAIANKQKYKEELRKDKREEWDHRKNVIRFRLGLKPLRKRLNG